MALNVTLLLTETVEREWKICKLELSAAELLTLSLSESLCERENSSLSRLFSLIRDDRARIAWIPAQEDMHFFLLSFESTS